MARQEILVYKDDLDGTEDGVQPRKFGLDGVNYEIDLSAKNYAKLAKFLAPFIEAGTKVSTRTTAARVAPARRAAATAEHKEFNARVRDWANGNGFKVKLRGRVPAAAVDAYLKAGKK